MPVTGASDVAGCPKPSAQQVPQQWLCAALALPRDAITTIEATELVGGHVPMAKAIIHVTYRDPSMGEQLPTSFFLKLCRTAEENSVMPAPLGDALLELVVGAQRVESGFYRHAMGCRTLQTIVPRAYHASETAILLDNPTLRPTCTAVSQWSLTDPGAPDVPLPVLLQALDALAVLHRAPPPASVDKTAILSFADLARSRGQRVSLMTPAGLAASMHAVVDHFHPDAPEVKALCTEAEAVGIERLLQALHRPGRGCIIHGDPNPGNMLHDEAGGMLLVDFQDATVDGHPAVDIARLLLSCLSPASLCDHEARLVEYYLQLTGFDPAEFRHDLQLALLADAMLILSATHSTIASRTPPLLYHLAERSAASLHRYCLCMRTTLRALGP